MNRVRPSFSSALISDRRPCTPLSPTVGQTAAAHIDANASGAASDPAAHAYVYTHQGNFPRFASLLPLLLGVHSLRCACHSFCVRRAVAPWS